MQADRYKSQGNAALQAGQYAEAVELYSKAIALEPSCEVYFSNRAAAYAGLERWREALDDSNEVTSLKPEWVKGWVRKGAALSGLGQHEEARKAYLRASQLEPGNAQVVQKMEAAAEAARKHTDKRWEDDLWSDEEDAPDGGGGGGGKHAAAGNGKSAAAGASSVAEPAADDVCGRKTARRKPSAALLAQLDRSLKDASEDTLRACLAQIAGADEELCERALHILEGLNAASSSSSSAEPSEEGGPGQGVKAWLRGAGGGASAASGGGKRRRPPGGSDSD